MSDHKCIKEVELRRLIGKVEALERYREIDRAVNADQFADIREQIRLWGSTFCEHFNSLKELINEKFDSVSLLITGEEEK